MKVYECENKSCTLGTRDQPGRFSGGAEPEQITVITGNPEPEHYGEGVCPNCGEKGKSVGTEPDPHKGTDPYQEIHDKIGEDTARERARLLSRAADPEDEMNEKEAQEAYLEGVADNQEILMKRIERAERAEAKEEGDDDAS